MSNARPSDIYNLCQFTSPNGRMCGLPAHPKGDGLCLTHLRLTKAQAKPREDDLSAELASPDGYYITQIDINHVLGKLFDALAANRLSARRASSLAYIASLVAQTQKAAKREAERWEIDLSIFKKLAALKNPEEYAKYAASLKQSAEAKSPATPHPPKSESTPDPVQ